MLSRKLQFSIHCQRRLAARSVSINGWKCWAVIKSFLIVGDVDTKCNNNTYSNEFFPSHFRKLNILFAFHHLFHSELTLFLHCKCDWGIWEDLECSRVFISSSSSFHLHLSDENCEQVERNLNFLKLHFNVQLLFFIQSLFHFHIDGAGWKSREQQMMHSSKRAGTMAAASRIDNVWRV